jgi:hypothetical protein
MYLTSLETCMPQGMENQLAFLPKMGKAKLLELWNQLYGKTAPPRIRRELMVMSAAES